MSFICSYSFLPSQLVVEQWPAISYAEHKTKLIQWGPFVKIEHQLFANFHVLFRFLLNIQPLNHYVVKKPDPHPAHKRYFHVAA